MTLNDAAKPPMTRRLGANDARFAPVTLCDPAKPPMTRRLGANDARFAPVTAAGDATPAANMEEQLHRFNRTLRALSASRRILIRVQNEADCLNEVCRIIVEDCGHAMVWIGYAESDEAKSVRPVASAGFEEGYLEALRITWADDEYGRGPTGRAIRTGKSCGCSNMLTDPQFAPWREQALKRGYASSLVLPLLAAGPLSNDAGTATRGGGNAFGAITIYSRQPDAFTPDEVELLGVLAEDLAYGITMLRLREANRRGEEALRLERDLLQAVMNGAKNAHLVYLDPHFNFIRVNETYAATCGYRPEEMIGKNHFILYPHPENEAIFARVRDTGQAFEIHDKPFTFPDQPERGVTYWDWTLIPVKDADGQVAGLVFSLFETTRRKQAEEALAQTHIEAEQRAAELQTVQDVAPVAVWIAHDAHCLRITGNRYADELVMRAPRGGNISASARPGETAVTYRVFRGSVELKPDELPAQVAVDTGRPVAAELLDLVFSDGRVTHMFMGATPLFDAEGRVRGAVAAGTDVTPLKDAETALKKNEDTLRGILNAAQESIWLFSPDGVIQSGNEKAFARMKKPASALIGKSMPEVIPPDLAELRMRKLREVVQSARPVEFEDERAGMLFRHSFYPVCDAGGGVTAVAAYSRDITDRKRAEESLRLAHERLALAQQAAGAAAWDWDLATGKLDWAPELFRLFGLDPARTEATFDAWLKAIHPEDSRMAGERVEAAVRDRRRLDSEYRVVLPSGEVRWIDAVGDTYYGTDGKASRMSGLCFDITRRKAVEEELRRHAEDLALFNRAAVGRELRMIELKREVNELRATAGLPPAYRMEEEGMSLAAGRGVNGAEAARH